MSDVIKKLSEIQEILNAPKNQYNKFGKYHYRSCEDIIQGVKPLLGDAVVLLSDEIKMCGDRIYIESTATFRWNNGDVSVKALAREPVMQKGMSEPQITGSASSYARKYALNGLFLIDDNKDADSQDNSKQERVLSATDKEWIGAVIADNAILETITDINYKAMIKKEAGI